MFDAKKIEEIINGIDHHLRKIEHFISDLKDVKHYLMYLQKTQEKAILYDFYKVKNEIKEVSNNLKKYGLPLSSEYEKNIAELKKLAEDGSWPFAVDPEDICNSEEDVQKRADSILDLLVAERMKDKRFLDFGCGKGHTIPAAKIREAKSVLGYDINDEYQFDKNDFTTNFDVVKEKAPYDIIVLHDVLDHAERVNPIEILKQASSVLAGGGKIYVRTHPWSSRHGGHLYLNKNLSFLHLIFDEIELLRLFGIESEHNIKIIKPEETYDSWIKESGLDIKNKILVQSEVEEFFKYPSAVNERLQKIWGESDFSKYLEIDFIEYILELKNEVSNMAIF